MKILRRIQRFFKQHIKPGVIIIIFVAVLMESINIIQYVTARRAIRQEVEHRAESELRTKRLEIQKVMDGVETAVHNVAWSI